MTEGRAGLVAGLVVGTAALLGSAAPAAAGEDQAVPGVEVVGAPCCGPGQNVRQLLRMSRAELEALYRQGRSAPVPAGFARGTALQYAGTGLAVPAARATHLLWQGKLFNAADCTLVNKMGGVQMIRARVYYGESWIDGSPSVIMDYRETSRVWADVRDELREVAPGLYLGAMFRRRCPEPRFVMFFALETAKGCDR
jgi:hypothetical protein